MKSFVALMVREWREWRMVMIVVGSLYVLGLAGSVLMFHKGSGALMRGDIHTKWDRGEWDFDVDEDDPEWLTPKEMVAAGRSQALLFAWTHMLRAGVSFINLARVLGLICPAHLPGQTGRGDGGRRPVAIPGGIHGSYRGLGHVPHPAAGVAAALRRLFSLRIRRDAQPAAPVRRWSAPAFGSPLEISGRR